MTKSKWILLTVFLVLSLAMLACSVCFTPRGSQPSVIEPTVVRQPTDSPGSEPDQPPQPEPTATETQVLPSVPTGTSAPTSAPTQEPSFGVGSTMVNPVDGAVLVYVPEGEFLMGSDDRDAYDDEKPAHIVYLDAFWIYMLPVTNTEYRACVDAGGCVPPGDTRYYSDPDYDEHPVVYVNWFAANAYCEWAEARLPTEAEWEKAIRGTDRRSYPWGDEDPTCDLANYWGCVGGTSPVGSYPDGASPYGALDMAGNVAEWVADWYEEDYYRRSPDENPPGPDSGDLRVRRSGSWSGNEWGLRVSFRNFADPGESSPVIGFRCLLSP